MKYFVTISDDRHITGCYPDDMFSDEARPEACVEINEEVWQTWLADQTQVLGDDLTMQPAPASLDAIKAKQIAFLTSCCAAAIVGGYSSSALGAPHSYPSNVTDQINMMGSVTASLLPELATGWTTPFWCEEASGSWAFRDHTAAQIQAAGADGKAHVVECQITLATLSAEVMAATMPNAIAAIVWPT
jgi:hypothetical protein